MHLATLQLIGSKISPEIHKQDLWFGFKSKSFFIDRS